MPHTVSSKRSADKKCSWLICWSFRTETCHPKGGCCSGASWCQNLSAVFLAETTFRKHPGFFLHGIQSQRVATASEQRINTHGSHGILKTIWQTRSISPMEIPWEIWISHGFPHGNPMKPADFPWHLCRSCRCRRCHGRSTWKPCARRSQPRNCNRDTT